MLVITGPYAIAGRYSGGSVRAQIYCFRLLYNTIRLCILPTYTAIDPEGMVFVHGEYWKARSMDNIGAGERVRVDKVENLVLVVRKAV